jgi:methanol--5-hydroxybenzimidazolylcobamide Co-methyltransferase
VGNIAQAVCDCWSNESVQNVRLLSAQAPTVSLEQLAYDCRLLNVASSRSLDEARLMRDWLTESDAALDPQAYVLRPDVVLRISAEIIEEPTPYLRTRRAVAAALDELKQAHAAGEVCIPEREQRWIGVFESQIDSLPDSEEALTEEMLARPEASKFLPEEYGLEIPILCGEGAQ